VEISEDARARKCTLLLRAKRVNITKRQRRDHENLDNRRRRGAVGLQPAAAKTLRGATQADSSTVDPHAQNESFTNR
jgi:hypothetical protein